MYKAFDQLESFSEEHDPETKLNVALIGQGFVGRTHSARGVRLASFSDAHLLGYEHGFVNHAYDIIAVLNRREERERRKTIG